MNIRAQLAILKTITWKDWVKIVLGIAAFIVFSKGVTIGFQYITSRLNLRLDEVAWLSYMTVFVTSLVLNLSVVAPPPLALSILISAATKWNPVLVGISAGVGSSIGEMAGYLAGYFGGKVLSKESFMCSLNEAFCISTITAQIKRYGFWAIGLMAVQPIIPFDIAGIIAGTLRIPVYKFFSANVTGKVIKYVFIAASAGAVANSNLLNLLPFK